MVLRETFLIAYFLIIILHLQNRMKITHRIKRSSRHRRVTDHKTLREERLGQIEIGIEGHAQEEPVVGLQELSGDIAMTSHGQTVNTSLHAFSFIRYQIFNTPAYRIGEEVLGRDKLWDTLKCCGVRTGGSGISLLNECYSDSIHTRTWDSGDKRRVSRRDRIGSGKVRSAQHWATISVLRYSRKTNSQV